MQNKHETKVIEINDSNINLLLGSGKIESISKDIFKFDVKVGDDIFAYFDENNKIVFVEKKDDKATTVSTKNESPSTNVYVTHATPQGYDEGSFWGGFLLTFFFPLVGLLISLILNKPETRRGAIRAITIQIIAVVVIVLFAFCALMY
jgi:thiol:disulfide interchange protein